MTDGDSVIKDEFNITLDTIPVEVFLHICTFLEAKEIVESLKPVCQSFNDILSDDAVWRTWLKNRWPELPSSNICYKDDEIPSQSICVQVDRGLALWSKQEIQMKKWSHETVHISTVDTVKLIQEGRIGISGSRDRSMAVWNTTDKFSLLQHKENAHDGWIWALSSCPQTKRLFSCSWDSNVKMWSLDQQLQQVSAFKCKAAALTLACRQDLVAAGLFMPRIELFDPRNGGRAITTYSSHSRSIMALCLVRDFIVSASEDHTIAVWDITAGRSFKSGIQVTLEGHPMTLSFSEGNLLFVGDTESKLHVFDTANDSFKMLESFDMGHRPRGQITSMWHNQGFIMTGSKDSTVRIHSTTRPPRLINQLTSSNGGITSVDFADPVLFAGCVNNAVELWLPS